MTVVTPTTRTQRVLEWGNGEWRLARYVRYCIAPTTPDAAVAHCQLNDEGCIVLAMRGPKGGWVNLSFVRNPPRDLIAKLTRERTNRTAHVGWFTHAPKGDPNDDPYGQHGTIAFRRYGLSDSTVFARHADWLKQGLLMSGPMRERVRKVLDELAVAKAPTTTQANPRSERRRPKYTSCYGPQRKG